MARVWVGLVLLLACEKPPVAASAPAIAAPSVVVSSSAASALGRGTQKPGAQADDDQRRAAAKVLLEHEAIGGIRLGMTPAEVVAIVGPPSWKGKRRVVPDEGSSEEWYWKSYDLGILFFGASMNAETVGGVSLGSSKLKTTKGVGVGSTVREVDAAYAAGHLERQAREYYAVGGEGGMAFDIGFEGTVKQVYWGLSVTP